ncbi:MAG: hypothetical protein WD489_07300 [Rhodovibrionaceae bacterium]
MTASGNHEVLEHAIAHLLLLAEEAPAEIAEEMRHIAARLQALYFSPFFDNLARQNEIPGEIPSR